MSKDKSSFAELTSLEKMAGALDDFDPRAPEGFGSHPSKQRAHQRLIYDWRRHPEKYAGRTDGQLAAMGWKKVPLKKFHSPRHPSVSIIPRRKPFLVVDESDDDIFPQTIELYFSSSSFHWDPEDRWVFQEFAEGPLARSFDVNQLAFLVPPYPSDAQTGIPINYVTPYFFHTRGTHCILSAILAEVIMARHGFTREQRAPVILTIGSHDCAMPAGGDSIKRIDPQGLNEETNYAWQLQRYSLNEKWRQKFGFNLDQASQWIFNRGLFGRLLDVVDKLSYVSLDCYYCGSMSEGQVRQLGLEHPLFMDLWEDLHFCEDRSQFGFTDPDRLYLFLLVRALAHRELYLNPYARALDFFATNAVAPLYRSGVITKEMLLDMGTEELEAWLHKRGEPGFEKAELCPDSLRWKFFKNQAELEKYFRTNGGAHLHHIDETPRFNPNLDWPVLLDGRGSGKTAPLGRILEPEKKRQLFRIRRQVSGLYAYWYDKRFRRSE